MVQNHANDHKTPELPGYLEQSRGLVNSLVLVIPLLVLYEAALFGSGFRITNRFDFISRTIAQYGFRGLLVFNALLFVIAVCGVVALNRRRKFDPAVLPGILVEGLAYALLLGVCVMLVLSANGGADSAEQPQNPVWLKVGLAVGAGVYEELFFRLLLVGFLYAWLQHAVGWRKPPAAAFVLVLSSVLFSLSHFRIPSLADFEMPLFAFRFIAGLALGGIFMVRGLGVAVYTHAIYNVIVLLKT